MALPYSYPSILQINLSALYRNYKILSYIVKNAEIAFTLKANAYGLGIKEIATFLKPYAKTFFVAYACEGVELRKILPQVDIYILHGSLLGEKEVFRRYNLIPVINSREQLEEWKNDIIGEGRFPFALQFDTGMSRLGLSEDDLNEVRRLNLEPSLIMSHLACADDENHPLNEQQYQKFLSFSSFFPGVKKSLSASSGIFLNEKYHFDMVRPGAALYGINPYKEKENPLENILKLSVSLQQSHIISKGCGVGYGHNWIAQRKTYVGTFNIGYADGISRHFSEKGKLWYRGYAVPIIGRISMDSLSVDLTNLLEEKPKKGTLFDIICDEQDINKIAYYLKTIPYEILTSLGERSKKIYFYED